MTTDPSRQDDPQTGPGPATDVMGQGGPLPAEAASAPNGTGAGPGQGPPDASAQAAAMARQRILIGSQRDPAAYRARPKRDWEPVVEDQPVGQDSPDGSAGSPGGEGRPPGPPLGPQHRRRHRGGRRSGHEGPARPGARVSATEPSAVASPADAILPAAQVSAGPEVSPQAETAASGGNRPGAGLTVDAAQQGAGRVTPSAGEVSQPTVPGPGPSPGEESPLAAAAPAMDGIVAAPETARPSRRQPISPEMEDELAEALGGASLDELMYVGDAVSRQTLLEPESRHRGRVVAVRRDDVFVELGGREQGCLSVRQFPEPPKPGTVIEVVVQKFHPEEGLYNLTLPGATADVGDWESLAEGMLVEAQVTGHNTGGLECDVNHLRGFIPASQIALWRVEDLGQFVSQRLTCLVTEVNPQRRNLVLSRRAVLEQEQGEAKKNFFESLQPGQVHQGVVRKLLDFGAFVDLGGGVDGLLHVSQLSWGRVNHPRDVLTEGQTIQVKIDRIDRESGRIGLSYRDMLENPWSAAATKYPTNGVVRGKVTKLMEFGAFVELEPGVEGLIHISELSHKRVWRTSDVVHEGDELEVLVLSVNVESQRISLSIKALSKPEPTTKEKGAAEPGTPVPTSRKRQRISNEPLQGGLGRPPGGDRLGLKW
ncbi:MAG: S1 RNA-binding domain-containing protein [Thermoguttaceae bacterium]